MWRKWRPEVIEADFALLSSHGINLLRIFPLWPDFQPIHLLRADGGRSVDYRWNENPLPDDTLIVDGVSPKMLERLEWVANLAEQHDIKLLIGLVTGWMSGRLFVPPALEGLDPLTDPTSIKWQVRMVRTIVRRLAKCRAVEGWDLGNECNVMGATTADQAWGWTAMISNAIRAADSTRPIISGMHSLKCNPSEPWSIRDQGELTDILTTHPYCLFTPHCQREPLNTMRPILHATAETRLYADLSQRPTFVEEFGSLGPMNAGEEEAAAYVRSCLVSQWAHGGKAALWWCAFDQTLLEEAPYDWLGLERELGLVRTDGTTKLTMEAMKSFAALLKTLPFEQLPPDSLRAVCILTPGQDQWAVAYSAFVLAKQAGFELSFHYADQALPEAELYLLPSLKGFQALTQRRQNDLWNHIKAGASLYISWENSCLSDFSKVTGLEISTQSERNGPCEFMLEDGTRMSVAAPMKMTLHERSATVLAREPHGTAAFSVTPLGKGKVYFLSAPIESAAAQGNEFFLSSNDAGWWKIYRTFAADLLAKKKIRKTNPWIGITEHEIGEQQSVAVLINYQPEIAEDVLVLAEGWALDAVLSGDSLEKKAAGPRKISLPPNGFAIWSLKRVSVEKTENRSVPAKEFALA